MSYSKNYLASCYRVRADRGVVGRSGFGEGRCSGCAPMGLAGLAGCSRFGRVGGAGRAGVSQADLGDLHSRPLDPGACRFSNEARRRDYGFRHGGDCFNECVARRRRLPTSDGFFGAFTVGAISSIRLSAGTDPGLWNDRHLDGSGLLPPIADDFVHRLMEAGKVGLDSGLARPTRL